MESQNPVSEAFKAMQAANIYVKPVKNSEGLTAGTAPLSLSEIEPILKDRVLMETFQVRST